MQLTMWVADGFEMHHLVQEYLSSVLLPYCLLCVLKMASLYFLLDLINLVH